MSIEEWWTVTDEGKKKLFGEKPPAAPLYLPQIIDNLTKCKD
jgi:hypothetical protein